MPTPVQKFHTSTLMVHPDLLGFVKAAQEYGIPLSRLVDAALREFSAGVGAGRPFPAHHFEPWNDNRRYNKMGSLAEGYEKLQKSIRRKK